MGLFSAARAAEDLGQKDFAISLYLEALRELKSSTSIRNRIGLLKFEKPFIPFLDFVTNFLPQSVAEVVLELRNPCNFRCSYCVASGKNDSPVERIDLASLELFYRSLNKDVVVTAFECGGGEPTIHPQIKDLIQLATKYGALSFPSNSSVNPERWLPIIDGSKVLIRSALHPEAERKIDNYLNNARVLIGNKIEFHGLFIAHPERIDKVHFYKDLFLKNKISFFPVSFIGEYKNKQYPSAYTDEEKDLIGISSSSRYLLHQIEPHITRIRNFRAIPCEAGWKSFYLKSNGSVQRCLYDAKPLTKPYQSATPCSVSFCGCGMLLKGMSSVSAADYLNSWGRKGGLTGLDFEKINKTATSLGYDDFNQAMVVETKLLFDEYMRSYEKNTLPE